MRGAERQQVIVDRLRAGARVGVAELAELTGASDMTVRRDLDYLAAQGVVRRVHGGAVSALPAGTEPPFATRSVAGVEAKAAIAEVVAGQLRDGEAVVLDSGTTSLAVARRLRDRTMTVMPLSLQVAQELVDAPGIRLLLPGGEPRRGQQALTGPLTLASLRSLRFDVAVISPCAFGLDAGLTVFDLGDAEVKRQALDVATRSIALIDGAKWDQAALAHVCDADRPDLIVTDPSAPSDGRAALAERGVLVQVAAVPTPGRPVDASAADRSDGRSPWEPPATEKPAAGPSADGVVRAGGRPVVASRAGKA